MNFRARDVELREVADAAYECTEWQCAEVEQPYAVVDLGDKSFPTIRELVPLYTVIGEKSPEMRVGSITWGEDQYLKPTFRERFYESNREKLITPSDDRAELIVKMLREGKQQFLDQTDGRQPNGSVSLFGMLAVYNYTNYRAVSETGEPSSFYELMTDSSIKSIHYKSFEVVSAKIIASRAFTSSVISSIQTLEEQDFSLEQPQKGTNATLAETTVLGAILHACAPEDFLHQRIKTALFS